MQTEDQLEIQVSRVEEAIDGESNAELAVALTRHMRTRARSERASWFKALSPNESALLLVQLRREGFSVASISIELKIPEAEVRAVWSESTRALGREVQVVPVEEVLGELRNTKERVVECAAATKDYGLVWRVEREYAKSLSELGVIVRKPVESVVRHKIEVNETVEKELEALAAFRREAAEAKARFEGTIPDGSD